MKKAAKPKLSIAEQIRRLEPGGNVVFPGGSIDSIKAIASRIGSALAKKFITRSTDGGVKVWRLE